MNETLKEKIVMLGSLSMPELQERARVLFLNQKLSFSNRLFLVKAIAYKLQENALGGLTDKAQTRIQELIKLYDPINNKVFRPDKSSSKGKSSRDRRLPIVGSEIIKKYKGQQYVIKVTEKGFEFNGKTYRSLSRIAEEITGVHWSGYAFFNL